MRKHKPSFLAIILLLVVVSGGAWMAAAVGKATVKAASTEEHIFGAIMAAACLSLALLGLLHIRAEIRGPQCPFGVGDKVAWDLGSKLVEPAQATTPRDITWEVTKTQRYQGKNGTVFALGVRYVEGFDNLLVVSPERSLLQARQPPLPRIFRDFLH